MANTLGELVVELTVGAVAFNEGLKKAESDMQKFSGKITEYVNKVAFTATAVGAAITGAYTLMIKASSDYSEQLLQVSERTGIAVETLSRLKFVADQTESSFEAVAQGFKFLNRNIYEATNGNEKINESFRTLGITLKDEVTGNVLKAEDVFFKIADVFRATDNAATKTALAMQVFGRQGESLIPVLNLGSEEIKRLSKEAERLGLVLTADNAKAIDQFSDSAKSLKSALGGLWLEISQLVMPALEKLIKFTTDVVVKIREWSEAHPKLSKNISELTLAVGALLLVLGPMILAFNQLAQAIIYLNVLFPGLIINVAKFGAVAAAAFAGWNLGRWISEITGLDEVLSGKKGLFTKMFEWLDKNDTKIQSIKKDLLAVATLGLSEVLKKEPTKATTPTAVTPEIPAVITPGGLDTTISLIDQHAQKLKELNQAYITGKMTAEQYMSSVIGLHEDGIEQKQRDLELLQQEINLQEFANSELEQRQYVVSQVQASEEAFYRKKAELLNQDAMDTKITYDSMTNLLQTIQSMHKTIWEGIFDFINTGIQKFSSGFSTALSNIILGTKNASEAFKEFGASMIEAVVNFVVQWGVQALIAMTLGSALAAATITIADSIAASWLPAAIFASIATLGAADAVGATGLASATGAGIALFAGMKTAAIVPIAGKAEGGFVGMHGPEVVLVGEKGPEFIVPNNQLAKDGPGNTFGDINISIDAVITKEADIDITDLCEKIGFEVQRHMHDGRGI